MLMLLGGLIGKREMHWMVLVVRRKDVGEGPIRDCADSPETGQTC